MKDIDEDIMKKALDGGEFSKEALPKPILLEDLGRIYATENSKHKARFGIYKCGFCGNNFRASVSHIKSNHTKSCGCYQKEKIGYLRRKHGLKSTRLYRIWGNMKTRVNNINNFKYETYGGRGITICDEWKNNFKSFYDWAMSNGYSDELSIDRIDNDGNYSPENCRWVGDTIQARNQRIPKNNKTGYGGVSYHKKNNKYVSYITVDKNRIYLGSFPTAVEAGITYNNYIIENKLEGFILNEIPEGYENG